jgi:hypothetical protein
MKLDIPEQICLVHSFLSSSIFFFLTHSHSPKDPVYFDRSLANHLLYAPAIHDDPLKVNHRPGASSERS